MQEGMELTRTEYHALLGNETHTVTKAITNAKATTADIGIRSSRVSYIKNIETKEPKRTRAFWIQRSCSRWNIRTAISYP